MGGNLLILYIFRFAGIFVYRRFQRYFELSSISTIFWIIVDFNDIWIMVAIIKGDIIGSRKLEDPQQWLHPFKELLSEWGDSPLHWEIVWGDSFQLELDNPEKALRKALRIKALIKKITPKKGNQNISPIDVRMAIGIGEKIYTGDRVSESNGPAFIYAGEKFEYLRQKKSNLLIQSPWPEFDQEINLYLQLAGIIMDNWTVSSAELMEIVLKQPDASQEEISRLLRSTQSSVSGRWSRAKGDEILEVEKRYRLRWKQYSEA